MPVPDWKSLLADTRVRASAIAALAGIGIAIAWWGFHAEALPPPVLPVPPPTAASGQPAPAQQPDAGAAQPGAAKTPPEPVSDKARITFVTNPPANATVSWGKVRLGVITPKQALVVVRPRDSGPLDVVVRSPGYMQVTTRAHTFGDQRIIVKLTTLEQKSTLLGYKAPIDAGLPDAGDGLPPPDAISAPPLP
ncbi:MAG TPA: hypothetical protein VJV78_07745 [Polyangiales bacterium]|nr:hypothetical protein [Polyangiales bacterium]